MNYTIFFILSHRLITLIVTPSANLIREETARNLQKKVHQTKPATTWGNHVTARSSSPSSWCWRLSKPDARMPSFLQWGRGTLSEFILAIRFQVESQLFAAHCVSRCRASERDVNWFARGTGCWKLMGFCWEKRAEAKGFCYWVVMRWSGFGFVSSY